MSETPFKSEHIKGVLFQAGAALKDSQTLEHSISYMIALLKNISEQEFTDLDFQNVMESNHKKTLGHLIKELGRHFTIAESLQEVLEDSLKARNYIVHHVFDENIELLLTPHGRKSMENIILSNRRIMILGQKAIDPIIESLMIKVGISFEELMGIAKKRYVE